REITFDGREPRRSSGLERHLRSVARFGDTFAVLVEGQIVIFDPVSFTFGEPVSVHGVAQELVTSPNRVRCYVGSRGLLNFTEVVNVAAQTTARLPFAPPTATMRLAHEEEDVETWISLPEKIIRKIRFSNDGPPRVLSEVEVPGLAGLERVYGCG